jgi:uncharacterized protein Yka (UPF0111/DUF47 family)
MLKWLGLMSVKEHERVVLGLQKEVVEAMKETNEALKSRKEVTQALNDLLETVLKSKEIAEVMQYARAMRERVELPEDGSKLN